MIGPAAVELEGVCKLYRRRGGLFEALAPLTLTVERGEVVALTGPNGVGKSTALRIVATLVEPSRGHVTVCGYDAELDPHAVRRAIGVSLGSNRSFYWRISARHNLSFFARLQGVPSRGIPSEIERLSDATGLAPFLDVPVRGLSRGSLARLAFARALLGDPDVLVLDEPFTSVDAFGRELMGKMLRRRAAEGRSALIATHGSRAGALCDRTVLLGNGRE
jgi:ABC-type multidrug transport system ATPase subunit